jgi:hypothetical protein
MYVYSKFLSINLKEKDCLQDLSVDGRLGIKICLKKYYGLYSFGSGQIHVAGSCKHG